MTSNMAESFNNVLRGIRRLPVTAIVAYTFSKCNTWFVDRHKFVTAALHKRERWPKRIKKELDIQKARTLGQRTTCFDFPTAKYEVTEQGGVTEGGVQWGGRHYTVVATANTCTCQYPELHHMPCSHMFTVCRLRRMDAEAPPRICFEASNVALQRTYSPRFEPYLDPTQWPSYDGEVFVPDLSKMIVTPGRRRTKRFINDMDRGYKGIGLGRSQKPNDGNSERVVPNRCSICHEVSHKKTTCPKRDKSKDRPRKRRCTCRGGEGPSTQVVRMHSLLLFHCIIHICMSIISVKFTICLLLLFHLYLHVSNFFFPYAGWRRP